MDRETLYKFFEGAASYEEEVRIRQWNGTFPGKQTRILEREKDIRLDVASWR